VPGEPTSRLAYPYERKKDLDRRARSYLRANCSQRHVGAGGGNSQIGVEFTTSPEKMRVFDVQPLHDTFGLSEARLIAPGSLKRSFCSTVFRIAAAARCRLWPLRSSTRTRWN
jgi:hypothetical protein